MYIKQKAIKIAVNSKLVKNKLKKIKKANYNNCLKTMGTEERQKNCKKAEKDYIKVIIANYLV